MLYVMMMMMMERGRVYAGLKHAFWSQMACSATCGCVALTDLSLISMLQFDHLENGTRSPTHATHKDKFKVDKRLKYKP